MKKKSIAAFLAILLGPFGLHRFYLGQRALGILYLLGSLFLIVITMEEHIPMFLLAILIATIDAILFAVMPEEEFDAKYNRHLGQLGFSSFNPHYRNRNESTSQSPRNTKATPTHVDYAGIIEDLQEDLENNFQQPKTHFHLACCYSRLEKSHEAFFHLEKVIAFGFVDFAAIHNHDDLAYVRSTPKFDKFVLNGYKNIRPTPVKEGLTLPLVASNATDNSPPKDEEEKLNLLDQIVLLGELRQKGILTEEEFYAQKGRLLK